MRCVRAWTVFLLIATIARGAAAGYDSPSGGFAMTPPAGWTTKLEQGEDFPSIFGPSGDKDAPYIVVKGIRDTRDVFEFGDASVNQMLKNPTYAKNVMDAFLTADREFGMKCVMSVVVQPQAAAQNASNAKATSKQPVLYRQICYFFQGPPGIMYIMLVVVADSGWTKYAQAIDDMARSYHMRPVIAPAQKKP